MSVFTLLQATMSQIKDIKPEQMDSRQIQNWKQGNYENLKAVESFFFTLRQNVTTISECLFFKDDPTKCPSCGLMSVVDGECTECGAREE